MDSAAEAFRWYRKAAERGDVDGQLLLGLMYEKGYGVLKTMQKPPGGTARPPNRGTPKLKTISA